MSAGTLISVLFGLDTGPPPSTLVTAGTPMRSNRHAAVPCSRVTVRVPSSRATSKVAETSRVVPGAATVVRPPSANSWRPQRDVLVVGIVRPVVSGTDWKHRSWAYEHRHRLEVAYLVDPGGATYGRSGLKVRSYTSIVRGPVAIGGESWTVTSASWPACIFRGPRPSPGAPSRARPSAAALRSRAPPRRPHLESGTPRR
jgi:hypothetical protein